MTFLFYTRILFIDLKKIAIPASRLKLQKQLFVKDKAASTYTKIPTHNLFVLEDIKKSDVPSAAIKNYLEQEKRLLQLPRIQYKYFFFRRLLALVLVNIFKKYTQ